MIVRCSILIPGHDALLKDIGDGCLLRYAHIGPHLAETVRNGYVLWQQDYECEDCDVECECFVWHEVSVDMARGLIEKS